MSNFTGMDIPGVRQLATQMDQRAEEIRTLMGQLTSALQSTQWVGPDREQFVGDWQSTHCQQLNHVIQGLSDAANRARQNAQQQEQASMA
jgi:uncharacterized protein YukE